MSSNLYERPDPAEEILLSEEGKQHLRDHPTASIALERVVSEGFRSANEFNKDRRRHPEKYPSWLRLPAPGGSADNASSSEGAQVSADEVRPPE